MNVDCNNCRARYRLDETMFKGSKGMQVRCRSCGNTILVLNPAEIASGMSVLNQVSASRDHSDKRSTEPAASLAKKEHAPPPEAGQPTPVEEPARIEQENRVVDDSWGELKSNAPPASEGALASLVFYPPFPKSPAKSSRRRTFKWSFLIPIVFLILLLFGGSVSLAFTQVGKRVLAGIGQELADAITFFRT
jgi:predicted Zn finger-like uncharacterized protein